MCDDEAAEDRKNKDRTVPENFGVAVESRRRLGETPPSTLLPPTDLPPRLAQGEEPGITPPPKYRDGGVVVRAGSQKSHRPYILEGGVLQESCLV